MLNKSVKSIFVALIAVFSLLLTAGCGGGGGGGGNPLAPGTDYSPTSVLAPNTIETLAVPAAVYSYDSKSANVSLKLPVQQGTDVNYALIVLNNGSTQQTIKLRPESYVLSGSLLARAEAEALRASQRLVEPAMSALDEARINQYPFEVKMRQDFIDSLRRAGSVEGMRKNSALRASDHSGEVVGTEVFLNIVGNSGGTSYLSRRCKLVRLTANCKIFIDQDPYEGLSAVDEGTYKITDEDIEHIATEFETYIYPLMSTQYGSVYNIDNDNRLSIVFSPVYPAIGFAGLFNTLHMNPALPIPENSNQRDMIGIWSPSARSSGAKWRMDARETVAHEMQHAINFSAKVYPGGSLRTGITNNADSFLEVVWLDESLSVGSEARYRLRRIEAGLDDKLHEARFDSWLSSSPHTYGMTSWGGTLPHYGQKGLFNYYLFEKYGAAKIQAMNQNTVVGLNNLENVYGMSIASLSSDFSLAVLNESLRSNGITNVATINPKYKFSQPINISMNMQLVTLGYTSDSLNVPALGTAYYLLKQPASFGGGEEFQFRIESTQEQPVEILIMRLPNP